MVRQMRLSQIVKWGQFYRNHWHCNIEKDILLFLKRGICKYFGPPTHVVNKNGDGDGGGIWYQ